MANALEEVAVAKHTGMAAAITRQALKAFCRLVMTRPSQPHLAALAVDLKEKIETSQ